jgi:hypothetical protein
MTFEQMMDRLSTVISDLAAAEDRAMVASQGFTMKSNVDQRIHFAAKAKGIAYALDLVTEMRDELRIASAR